MEFFLLVVASFTMLYGLLDGLYYDAINNNNVSIRRFICDPDGTRWSGGTALFWMWCFALSKFFELFDTVILVCRGKKPNFLHWYHHISVLLYTWWAIITKFSPGWLFGTINCFVHSIMYDYYKVASYGIKLTYAKSVTKIQIIQMMAGILLTLLWIYYHYLDANTCTCDHSQYIITSAIIMYASYLTLFSLFYINRYNKKKKKLNQYKSKNKIKFL